MIIYWRFPLAFGVALMLACGGGGSSLADATADPGEFPVVAPDGPGPYETATRSAEVTRGDRTIKVVAHLPLRGDGKASPVVVFLPGFQASIDLYHRTVDRLASHGFLAVRAQLPGSLVDVSHVEMAADVSAVINWALDPAGLVGGLGDPDRVGATGHSLGGKVAVMAAFADPRVKAVFAIDPVNGGNPFTGYSEALPDIVPDQVAPLAIPLGFPGEDWSADHTVFQGLSCAPADQNFRTFYEAATSSPWRAMWVLAGADHQDFVDNQTECGFICSVCPDGPGDDEAQLEAVRTLQAAFFRRHFLGEAAMDDWLFGALMPPEATVVHAP